MQQDWRVLGGVSRDGLPENPRDQEQTESAPSEPVLAESSTYRVVDWSRAIGLTLTAIVSFPLIIAIAQGSGISPVIAGLISLLVVAAIVKTHFSGLVVDLAKDRLLFPTLLFRRSIRFSQIRDANAEYIHRSFKTNSLDTSINPKSEKETIRLPIYAANLSGDFGVRQVKFWSKKRRDQFLSLLRTYAPNVRITRWSGW